MATAGAATGGHGDRSPVLQTVKVREKEREREGGGGLVPHRRAVRRQPRAAPAAGTPRLAKLSLDYRLRNRRDRPPTRIQCTPPCQLLTLPPLTPTPLLTRLRGMETGSMWPLGLELKPFLWLLTFPK